MLLRLAVLTVVLLALSAWGFSRLAAGVDGSALTSGEARLAASMVLNLVMFGFSLIAALGTAFLAGPTLAGEMESGIALAMLARPIRRSAVLLGKWLGLVAFGSGFVVARRAGPVPRRPGDGRLLAAAPGDRPRAARGADDRAAHPRPAAVDSVISPMASGVVAVGLFGATWVAGVVGGSARPSATTASRASAPSPGCCCPPTACGAGRCTRSRTRRRSSSSAARRRGRSRS